MHAHRDEVGAREMLMEVREKVRVRAGGAGGGEGARRREAAA